MSRLLNQEQRLAASRTEHRRRASTRPANPEPTPQKPEPLLLITHQPPSEPISVTRSSVQLLKLRLRLSVARWALVGVAACGALVVASARGPRPAGEAALPHRASMVLALRQLPTFSAVLQAPVTEVLPSQPRSQVDRRRRAQEMELALADTQRVMALMERAMRQAARAYVSAPAPSSSAGSSRADTSS